MAKENIAFLVLQCRKGQGRATFRQTNVKQFINQLNKTKKYGKRKHCIFSEPPQEHCGGY